MPQRTRIKFCGMTRPDDALAAAEAGADAIGLVFYKPVARYIAPEAAERILAVLPPFVTPVGLFVDAPTGEVLDVTRRLHLRHVQMHGHETPEQVAELRGLRIIKAVRVSAQSLMAELDRWRRAIADHRLDHVVGILLETANTAQPGGTGVENDWATIRRLRHQGAFDGLPPVIAAGGLRPDNVAAVVRELRPWVVDVSSGVEREKGKKSVELMAAFAGAVRVADLSE